MRRLIQANFAGEFECKSAVSPTLCHIQLRAIFVRESTLTYRHQRQLDAQFVSDDRAKKRLRK